MKVFTRMWVLSGRKRQLLKNGVPWAWARVVALGIQNILKPKSAGANFHLGGGGYTDFIMNNFEFFLISLKIIISVEFTFSFWFSLLYYLWPCFWPSGRWEKSHRATMESEHRTVTKVIFLCQVPILTAVSQLHPQLLKTTACHTGSRVHLVFSLPYWTTRATFPALFLTSLFSL